MWIEIKHERTELGGKKDRLATWVFMVQKVQPSGFYCYNSMIGTKMSLWLIVVDTGDPSIKNHSILYKVIRRVQGTKEGLNKSLSSIRYSPPNKAVQTRFPSLKLKTVDAKVTSPRHTNKRE